MTTKVSINQLLLLATSYYLKRQAYKYWNKSCKNCLLVSNNRAILIKYSILSSQLRDSYQFATVVFCSVSFHVRFALLAVRYHKESLEKRNCDAVEDVDTNFRFILKRANWTWNWNPKTEKVKSSDISIHLHAEVAGMRVWVRWERTRNVIAQWIYDMCWKCCYCLGNLDVA